MVSLTEKLWFKSSLGTNYQLWRTHVRHHFQAQELLGFIDGTNPPPPETTISLYNSKLVRNPDYLIWKRIDQSLKQGILSLLEDDVVLDKVNTEITTSRDLWLYLERKFQKHIEQLPTGKISDDAIIFSNVEQGQLSRASDEFSELYIAALLGNKTAGQHRLYLSLQEVEKLIHPRSKEQVNTNGKTPRMIFENEHKKLRDEGEKWVKDTINMCTITAALISTIMFAASITVPGGTNSSTGLPFFESRIAFICFAVSDAISLFTSASSLLLFLHIATFRYKEDDFLYSVPEQLVFGLMLLIVSITSMMITFGATLNVMFNGRKLTSLCSIVAMSLVIVVIFGYLLRHLVRDFTKLLNRNQGFLGKRNEPHLVVASSSSGNVNVFERKVASHESV